ncbi:MAG: hypothetical protein CFH21_01039 [Alphaproteobacteria bacterium MarineAlpha5_Bin11]|nr:hypothetical protein [Pelagibacteraceae bacterium]PPR42695.1 MAG: hypothetical protein CFH21_01039 [Alphaproteobacteria bacterium MarineAlpha5_Bin11]PPR52102.1 MAG: hypothetical protein CFH20_00007 [Alphaproteobacteria bacterium MarineAlpha5_Bin10]
MDINHYDYVETKGSNGKIILTCFPGRQGKKISFDENILLNELSNFNKLNCSTVVSLVEDSEFKELYDKKDFVRHVYSNNLKWIHLPIEDLKAPDQKFIDKWQATKTLIKNDLMSGKNIVLHCMGGKGRSGTVAAILLLEFKEHHKDVIKIVRKNRKGAIETKDQEDFILSYRINN